MTLWTVKHLLQGQDFIISNGDNLYKDHVIREVVQKAVGKEGVFITVDHKDQYDSDDMKVVFKDQKESIARVHKQIKAEEAQAESVGLVLVKGVQAREYFLQALIYLAKMKEGLRYFWLEILNQLVHEGYLIKPIFIERDDWREMDFHPDVEMIRNSLLKNLF
jgi:choline kinase